MINWIIMQIMNVCQINVIEDRNMVLRKYIEEEWILSGELGKASMKSKICWYLEAKLKLDE